MSTPLFVPSILHDGPNTAQILIPFVSSLPLEPTTNRALILSADVGPSIAGLYIWKSVFWQFAMPIEAVSALIINGDSSELYINVVAQQTLPAADVVYRNGQLQADTVIEPGTSLVYSVRIPVSSVSGVESVNGMTGVVIINAANLPGLALVAITGDYNDLINKPASTIPIATDTILGGVMVPVTSNISVDGLGNIDIKASLLTTINNKLSTITSVGDGVSLIDGSTATNVNLRSIKAGSNVTIINDGLGNVVVAGTASPVPVATTTELGVVKIGTGLDIDVDGLLTVDGGGIVTLEGDVTGVGAGVITTVLSNNGVVPGTYTKVTVDAKGRVTVGAMADTLADYGIIDALPLAGGSMTGNIVMTSGSKLTGQPTPVLGTDVTNKTYVDGLIANVANGVSWRLAAKAATVANITLTGLQTIDGYALQDQDRVLVKDQTTQSQNGMYVAQSGAWVRTLDADTGPELLNMACLILNGTTNGLTQWVNVNTGSITIGSTLILFSQLNAVGTAYTAGLGLQLDGEEFSIAPTGVTAGVYSKVSVNARGQVVAGLALGGGDISGALGYTPYNGTTNPLGFLTEVPETTFIGDIEGSGSSTILTSLTETGVATGTYSKVTVDSKGRVTAGAQFTSADIINAIGYTPYNGAANPQGFITGNQTITLVGDVMGSGTSTIFTSLPTTGVAPGEYVKVTVDSRGRVTDGSALDQSDVLNGLGYTPLNRAGGTMTGPLTLSTPLDLGVPLNLAPAVTMVAASNTVIAGAASNTITIQAGSAAINSFGAAEAGMERKLIFNAVLTLTNNSQIILPGDANIVTAVGDVAYMRCVSSGTWKCDYYTRADGRAVVTAAGDQTPFTNIQEFRGSATQMAMRVINGAEVTQVIAGAPSSLINLYANLGAVKYYTSSAGLNWTMNFSHSSSATLDSVMNVGDSTTFAVMITLSTVGYYPTQLRVDGNNVTPKWQGGVAPSGGNPNGIDIYTVTIIKTAAATFTVFAAQTQYA